MPNARDDLRATSDDAAADAKELAAVEERKGELDPSDPRNVDLSESAEELANSLATKTKAERELVDETTDSYRQQPEKRGPAQG